VFLKKEEMKKLSVRAVVEAGKTMATH
jgi:hypothetical protein